MSDQISITLPGYQWEAILRGLASSGWDSMHAVVTEKLAAVAKERPCTHDDVDFQSDYWVCRACGHREVSPHAKSEGAEHEGHRILESPTMSSLATGLIPRTCTTCDVELEPRKEPYV